MTYLSRVTAAGDGSTTVYPVTFTYSTRDDVEVYWVQGGTATLKTDGLHYDWTSPGTIAFRSGYKPPAGSTVLIRRNTSKTPVNDFGGGGAIHGADIAENDQQLIYLVEETQDTETDCEAATAAVHQEVVVETDARAAGDQNLQSQINAGIPGAPGANVMALSLFTAASSVSIPIGTDIIRTSGYSTTGKGAADYIYDAAVDAAYVTANPRTSFRSSNARGFRLSPYQAFNIEQFGCVADNVTDNYAQLLIALAFLAGIKMTTQFGFGFGSPPITIPARPQAFACSQTLNITFTAHIIWENGAGAAGGCAVLDFPQGQHGIVIVHDNVTGGGAGTILDRPFIVGGFGTAETGAYHGIWMQASTTILCSKVYGFEGDGIFADTHGTGHNINGSLIDNPFCYGNRRGIYLNGEDCNGVTIINPVCIANRQYGLWKKLDLGGAIIGGIMESNGSPDAPSLIGSTVEPTMCAYDGGSGFKRYYCLPNQEAWASTHPPTGDTTANQGWGYYQDGGAVSTIPVYSNGMAIRAGGAARFEGAFAYQTLASFYVEPNQAPIQIEAAAKLIGLTGISGVPVMFDGSPYGGWLEGSGSGLNARRGFTVGDVERPTPNVPNSSALLQVQGDVYLTRHNANTYNPTLHLVASGAGTSATISYETNAGIQARTVYDDAQLSLYDLVPATGKRYFYVGASNIGHFSDAGLEFEAGKVVKVNAQQVLGGRLAALPADATDLPTAIALANAIKARIKTTGGHGLVAD